MGCETSWDAHDKRGPGRSACALDMILYRARPVGRTAKMAVLRPRLPRRDSSYRESFSTAKSDLIMASYSQSRRSVRRDVEAGMSRQSGATTTPTNHPEK